MRIPKNRIEFVNEICKEFPSGKAVEVGTFKGGFSIDVIKDWYGTLYMVDVWRPLGEEYLDASNHVIHTNAYAEAIESIRGFEERAIMIRASSEKASDIFPDNSLDFVYIDANHAYDFVNQDIHLWYPKVKEGGYLGGHDYINIDWYQDPNYLANGKDKHIWSQVYHGVFGVNPAVDEFCQINAYDLMITNEWFGSWFIKK